MGKIRGSQVFSSLTLKVSKLSIYRFKNKNNALLERKQGKEKGERRDPGRREGRRDRAGESGAGIPGEALGRAAWKQNSREPLAAMVQA